MALTGLQEKTESLAEEHHVPGVAVGIFCDGEEHYAYHGVTSVENPLAVGASTLFQIGSTTKTYTATAIMALAEAGEVGLNDPVRAYVPELRLKDEAAARAVTVVQLLNHSAGWNGDYFEDTGDEQYIISDGQYKGMKGSFARTGGRITGISFAGRLAVKE